MKLIIKLVVVMAILLFITIHHTYSKQENPVKQNKTVSEKINDTITGTELFSPTNIILVELP